MKRGTAEVLNAIGEGALRHVASALGAVIVAGVSFDVLARIFAAPVTGGTIVAGWALAWLAMVCIAIVLPRPDSLRNALALVVCGLAFGALGPGLADAALRVGGTEPILAVPNGWRPGIAAGGLGFSLIAYALCTVRGAALVAVGAAVGAVAPDVGPVLAIALFALALALRVPVALGLIAAVSIVAGPLSDAALAQTVLRGLTPSVLIAVPLFIIAAAFMVAGGVGEAIVAFALWVGRGRRAAAGEANVIASLLFGGVSGSGIADAALGARLLAPPMVRAGHSPADAAALTAAAAIVPNLMPPSIALLLAAAATDQSVGRLWIAGIGAAAVTVAALLIAIKRCAPSAVSPRTIDTQRPPLLSLVPPLAIAVAVLGGLRAGLVTPTEAGILAVLASALFATVRRGGGALWPALAEASVQAGKVALIIAAAAPVSFLIATSGIDWTALVPSAPAPFVLAAAVIVCLAAGTVLDVGAAILLLLPLLVPAVTAAGGEPIHATLVLVTALLIGGLTPPVGILVLTVREITGATGVFAATRPYLAALGCALIVLIAIPWLTAGLAAL